MQPEAHSVICDQCHGARFIPVYSATNAFARIICPKCAGVGEVLIPWKKSLTFTQRAAKEAAIILGIVVFFALCTVGLLHWFRLL